MGGHAISFGPFRLLAAQRLLLEGGEPVLLGSRAFDILAALVELPGEVVGKEDSNYYSRPKAFGRGSFGPTLSVPSSTLKRQSRPVKYRNGGLTPGFWSLL